MKLNQSLLEDDTLELLAQDSDEICHFQTSQMQSIIYLSFILKQL